MSKRLTLALVVGIGSLASSGCGVVAASAAGPVDDPISAPQVIDWQEVVKRPKTGPRAVQLRLAHWLARHGPVLSKAGPLVARPCSENCVLGAGGEVSQQALATLAILDAIGAWERTDVGRHFWAEALSERLARDTFSMTAMVLVAESSKLFALRSACEHWLKGLAREVGAPASTNAIDDVWWGVIALSAGRNALLGREVLGDVEERLRAARLLGECDAGTIVTPFELLSWSISRALAQETDLVAVARAACARAYALPGESRRETCTGALGWIGDTVDASDDPLRDAAALSLALAPEFIVWR